MTNNEELRLRIENINLKLQRIQQLMSGMRLLRTDGPSSKELKTLIESVILELKKVGG